MSNKNNPKENGLTERVALFFAPHGDLAEALSIYEPRAQQSEMAIAVARTISRRQRAIIEAGTGTGKTLAYLVPTVLSGAKTLISTATKNLQEQIFNKDIPLLMEMGLKVEACYLKGRNNYLCLYRFWEFKRAPLFRSSDDQRHFPAILKWAEETESGDRAELSMLPDDYPTWSDLSTGSEGCLGTRCPDREQCFVTRVRRQAARAQIIVVNHHLFFADLAIRSGGFGEVLPPVDAVVFDEAHHLEEIATNFFGRSVSIFRYLDLKSDVERSLKDLKQVPLELKRSLRNTETTLRETFEVLNGFLPHHERTSLDSSFRDQPEIGESLSKASIGLGELAKLLDHSPALGELAEAYARRCNEIRSDLQFVLDQDHSSWVSFAEKRGRAGSLFLHCNPIDLSEFFVELLYPTHPTTVFTSATLSVEKRFHYFRSRIALGQRESVEELRLESSFDFMQQALLFVPQRMPEPSSDRFVSSIAPVIEELLALTQGRAFLLCTSYRNMRELHSILERRISYPLLMQGERSRFALLEAFRRTPSVLIATSSFWEGVDVVGDHLSLVVMDKLPFASPFEPVISARINYIREQGGNPFQHYQLPQAAIALKQGFGRLIRHREDRGIVAIMDRRVMDKPYGKVFLDTLPPIKHVRQIEQVRQWWHDQSR